MGLRKKDDVNDDADSVVSSNGSVSAARSLSKRSRQSLNKSLSNENLKTSPVGFFLFTNISKNNLKTFILIFLRPIWLRSS